MSLSRNIATTTLLALTLLTELPKLVLAIDDNDASIAKADEKFTAATSDLEVNEHAQKETSEHKDHKSVTPEFAAAETAEK